jgi:phosphocarrier protein HPr
MEKRELEIINRSGLHARAAAKVVQIASQFRCRVALVCAGRRASARSIVAVMLLAASVGSTIVVEAEGPDERGAMTAIAALFETGFGEQV